MAITKTADAAQTGVQPKGLRVGLNAVKAVVSFDGSSSIGTIGYMVKVPANATVVYMDFQSTVLGQYTLNVGDSVNEARYYSNATTSGAVGVLRPANLAMMEYQYSADDTIQIKMSLVSVVSSGGAFYMNVIFSLDC